MYIYVDILQVIGSTDLLRRTLINCSTVQLVSVCMYVCMYVCLFLFIMTVNNVRVFWG